jgi:riboflavin synthase
MFTGLIEGKGTVKALIRSGDGAALTLRSDFPMDDLRLGDSLAVSGVCLTITEIKGDLISMDVSGETLSRSTLGALGPGSRVNLERALRLSDRLGGHLVSGHVDGLGKILKKDVRQGSWLIGIGLDESLSRYTIEKGSVAVDGISLTINHCQNGYFEVTIIPQTVKETTLLSKKVGDAVNIETDLIGKYVEKFFRTDNPSEKEKKTSGIDRGMLDTFGFGR